MKVIRPQPFTSSMLTSTTATESVAAYSSGTTYAKDALVSYNTKIYQSLQNSNLNKQPDLSTSALWWIEIRSDNRYAAFDTQVGQRTTATTTLTMTIYPNALFDSVALIDVDCLSTKITVRDGAGGPIIYEQTAGLVTSIVGNWYEYYFTSTTDKRTQLVFTNIPTTTTARITLEFSGAVGDIVSVGEVVWGTMTQIGTTQYGVSTGITDYSVKQTDEYGNTKFVERAFSKRMSAQVHLPNSNLNSVQLLLYSLRATPSVWVASDDPALQEPLVVFGYYKDFSTEIAYPSHSICNLEIEGLI